MATPDVTELLLAWPSALEELYLSFPRRGSRASACHTGTFIDTMAHVHHKSLRKLELGPIPSEAAGIPDLSSFTELEQLQIYVYDIYAETPSEMSSRLSAPKLRRLILDYMPTLEESGVFEGNEVMWLMDFIQALTSEYPRSALQHIHLLFDPNGGQCRDEEELMEMICLKDAKRFAGKHGIRFTHRRHRRIGGTISSAFVMYNGKLAMKR